MALRYLGPMEARILLELELQMVAGCYVGTEQCSSGGMVFLITKPSLQSRGVLFGKKVRSVIFF